MRQGSFIHGQPGENQGYHKRGVTMMDKLLCICLGHNWLWRKSYPFERTGTSKDMALVPAKCLRCEHVPNGAEVSKLAKYEGKP